MKKNVLLAALLLVYSATACAQIVGATNNQEVPRTRTSDTSPLYRPTGSYLRFEGGLPIIASVAYCYQFTPSFMLGGGIGFGESGGYFWSTYNNYENSENLGYPCMPLFIEAELRTPRYKWSLFLNVKFGYNAFRRADESFFNEYDYHSYGYCYYPFLSIASTGVSYKNFSFGAGYSTVYYFNAFISYSLPLSKIKLDLF